MDNQRKKISGASLSHAFEEIIWPRRKLIFVGLLLIVLNRGSGLVLPASTKYLVDNAIVAGDMDMLWLILGAVSLAVLVQALTSYALTLLLSVEAQMI